MQAPSNIRRGAHASNTKPQKKYTIVKLDEKKPTWIKLTLGFSMFFARDLTCIDVFQTFTLRMNKTVWVKSRIQWFWDDLAVGGWFYRDFVTFVVVGLEMICFLRFTFPTLYPSHAPCKNYEIALPNTYFGQLTSSPDYIFRTHSKYKRAFTPHICCDEKWSGAERDWGMTAFGGCVERGAWLESLPTSESYWGWQGCQRWQRWWQGWGRWYGCSY